MTSKNVAGEFVYVSEEKARTLKANLAYAGDIVFTQRGTLGQVSIVPDCGWDIYLISQSQMKASLNPNLVDVNFCYYIFTSDQYQEKIAGDTIQTGVPHINLGILKKIKIPVPPLPEQRAIASALSDIDALIAAQDRLISKKRDLKTASMQALLSGKQRLPGFAGADGYKNTEVGVIPEDWEVKALGGIVSKVGSGKTPTGGERIYKTSGRPFVRSQNIGWGFTIEDDLVFIDEETHNTFLGSEIELNDVMLNITGASIGRCAVATERLSGGNVNQHVCLIRCEKDSLDANFLLFYLLSTYGQSQINALQAGGNRQGLNFSQVRALSLTCPPLDEQRAIAQVLSDMDAEIEALEAQRDKTAQIKQGMMQELLTGKTRLV